MIFDTISKIHAQGWTVWLTCRCGRASEADLAKILEDRGDLGLKDFREMMATKARCTSCGRLGGSIRIGGGCPRRP